MHAVFKENKIGIVQPAYFRIFVSFLYNVILTAAALQSKSCNVQICLIVQMLLHIKCKVKTLGSSALKNHPSEISTPVNDLIETHLFLPVTASLNV